MRFWRSVDLTGNQTFFRNIGITVMFWRSVDLTGNQTIQSRFRRFDGFGAVSI